MVVYPMKCIDSALMSCFHCCRLVTFRNRWRKPDTLHFICFGILPGKDCSRQESQSFISLRQYINNVSSKYTMPYSTLFQPAFWQCSCRRVTGNLPVHDEGATKVRGLGRPVELDEGSLGGVAGLLCFPFFTFPGGPFVSGPGSVGF